MGLTETASASSVFRGYEYFKSGYVLMKTDISDHEYKGIVKGSRDNRYNVFVDLEHPRKSHCDCPHAKGRRIVCKHQIALYFSAVPKAAEKYYKDVVKYIEEEERRQEETDDKVIAYIKSLSKEQLRQALYETLYDGPDWLFERFVAEHIDL